MKLIFEIGDCFSCPIKVADTKQLIIVGIEKHTMSPRLVVRGGGEFIYHVCEAKDGQRIVGKPSFCVGSDEAAKWQQDHHA